MRAFLVGLVFLIATVVLVGVGVLLFPFIVALVWFLRIIVSFLLVIFAIWLLGKIIIFTWTKVQK